MQTIAWVNRVYKDKPRDLNVDYLGLAYLLRKALASGSDSGREGEATLKQGAKRDFIPQVDDVRVPSPARKIPRDEGFYFQ